MNTENNNNPKVSIVVSFHNSLNLALDIQNAACYQSILSQNFHDYEIIAVNNREDEARLSIEENSCAGKRIKYIETEKDSINTALNTAIQNASGTYIQFLFPDSVYAHQETISQYIDIIEQTKANLVYADTSDNHGDLHHILWKNSTNFQTCFFETDSIRKLNGFNSEMKQPAHTDLLVRALLNDFNHVKTNSLTVQISSGTNQNSYETDNELTTETQEKVISRLGISISEYKHLKEMLYTGTLDARKMTDIISKIPCYWGSSYLINEMLTTASNNKSRVINTTFYLFGCLPVFRTKTRLKG